MRLNKIVSRVAKLFVDRIALDKSPNFFSAMYEMVWHRL